MSAGAEDLRGELAFTSLAIRQIALIRELGYSEFHVEHGTFSADGFVVFVFDDNGKPVMTDDNTFDRKRVRWPDDVWRARAIAALGSDYQEQPKPVHFLAVAYDLDTTIFGVFDSLEEAVVGIDNHEHAWAGRFAVIEEWAGGKEVAHHLRDYRDRTKWTRHASMTAGGDHG